jgi:hypothetical protein
MQEIAKLDNSSEILTISYKFIDEEGVVTSEKEFVMESSALLGSRTADWVKAALLSIYGWDIF